MNPLPAAALLSLAAIPAAPADLGRIEVDLSGPGWTLWLDREASWQDDPLFLPPVDLARVPPRPPTGGWESFPAVLAGPDAHAVSVPGTVEEYLHPGNGPEGDYKGVSWWVRTLDVPVEPVGRRATLQLEAVRERAEVYLDGTLVAYDLVGSTPFDVDLTPHLRPGRRQQLAVRVTDPGGNFDWRDSSAYDWGAYKMPASHGFGGISGAVRLLLRDGVHVADVYVQNTPKVTTVEAHVTVRNATAEWVTRDVTVDVVDPKAPGEPVRREVVRAKTFQPGDNTLRVTLAVPSARLWDVGKPNLYTCAVRLTDAEGVRDRAERRFGFRWFEAEGIGEDAVFRLNGRRIVLRSSISWGFWPRNGLYPTATLARRQIESAKAMGLNMLHFHRAIGQPILLDLADEHGLLYYEEPGGYITGDVDLAFTQRIMKEKVRRMVRRDRSHPSLVIYNLINEGWAGTGFETRPEIAAARLADLEAVHVLDPSRTVTHTTAWARAVDLPDPSKLHYRPFDDTLHRTGWYDVHHAGGPETWNDSLYESPTKFHLSEGSRREIVFWGEEGALSSPPRLGLIGKDLAAAGSPGWDGAVYREWIDRFTAFMKRKGLFASFPTLDHLTTALGTLSLEHQGRRIENIRVHDLTDGYTINGWEAQIIENHSGVVDCFRYPKADPAIVKRYTAPLHLAVKLRSQVHPAGATAIADVFVVNEVDLRGPHRLEIAARDPRGTAHPVTTRDVDLKGGDVFGQLLAEAVAVPLAGPGGLWKVEARLLGAGVEKVKGWEDLLTVDWKTAPVPGRGAVWEASNRVRRFLAEEKNAPAAEYADALGPLDWVVVARSPNEGEPEPIPRDRFTKADGTPGLSVAFHRGRLLEGEIVRREHQDVDFSVDDGATPDPAVTRTENWSMVWTGRITPPIDGTYAFAIDATWGVQLDVGGRRVIDSAADGAVKIYRGTVDLAGGAPVDLRLQFGHRRGPARCRLLWSAPETGRPDVARLLSRVRDQGTTLLVLDRAEEWMPEIAKATGVRYSGSFKLGRTWLGGSHFVRRHGLFADLPVDVGMSWPYQAVVRDGHARTGLKLDGEELVVGAWHSYPMELGTAVGVIRHGKGRIIVSTLDICDNLAGTAGPSHVGRKLLGNFLLFGRGPGAGKAVRKAN